MSNPYNNPYDTFGPGGPGDPRRQKPRTNLYGQPIDPYPQQAVNPYGSYGGGTYGVNSYAQRPVKSKGVAALLAFFLGIFGAHSFYLGRKGLGLGHLALLVVGFLLSTIGAVVAGGSEMESYLVMASLGSLVMGANSLWAFVEFIIILVKPESDLGR